MTDTSSAAIKVGTGQKIRGICKKLFLVIVRLLTIVAVVTLLMNGTQVGSYLGDSNAVYITASATSSANHFATSIPIELELAIDHDHPIIDPTINKSSLIVAQVKKIIHVPRESKIMIYMKDNSSINGTGGIHEQETRHLNGSESTTTRQQEQCRNPYFVGRLSGRSLATIEWVVSNNDENTNLNATNTTSPNSSANPIIGYYQVPTPGRYHIEILGLLCNRFTFETNFYRICLEDPDYHRITQAHTFIDVPATSASASASGFIPQGTPLRSQMIRASSPPLGYWQWANKTQDPVPLYTRYQPKRCPKGNDNRLDCINQTSIDRFAPYRFIWEDGNNISDENRVYNHGSFFQSPLKICLVGFSHSRVLNSQMVHWRNKWNLTNVTIIQRFDAKYPNDVSNKIIQKLVNFKCNKTLVAVGQWSLGRRPRYPRPPILFPDFKGQMTKLIERFAHATQNVGLHLRSIHDNPLGDIKVKCPPEDWRTPATIDGYNAILHSLSLAMDVPFIDTSFIIRPMWDSSADWCHYQEEAGIVEAAYLLHTLL